MKFGAEQYYNVSLERIEQARTLYHSGEAYALTIYCGGLAVESLMRAFRWEKDSSFDGRHDLSILLSASRILRIDDEYLRSRNVPEERFAREGKKLREALNEVMILWRNDLRFASESGLRAYLKNAGRLDGIKGDALKKNAYDFLSAAQEVINRGVILWTSKKKS